MSSYEKRYPIADKFTALSTPIPNCGCVIWIGALNHDGYGRVKIRSVFHRAHIVAWELANGPVPDGLVLDHRCRIRCCVNPDHLEAITQSENARRANLYRYHGTGHLLM